MKVLSRWRLARSWYEASFALAVLYLFYAVWIFVTGYTPVKFNSRPIPREYVFTWLAIAIVPFVVGIIAYLRERKKNS
jgi:Ca2+/Na+ antiporter